MNCPMLSNRISLPAHSKLCHNVQVASCKLPTSHRLPQSCTVVASVVAAAQADSTPEEVQEVVVGIDLGTTNSAAAYIVDGHPVCIPNSVGDTLTPSIVSFQPDGTTLVGRAAKQAQSKSPSTTYYSVKRLIGRSWADSAVQEESQRLAYTVRGLCGV
jgi:hypothetical protein